MPSANSDAMYRTASNNNPTAASQVWHTLWFWQDEVPRTGSENMSVDELLLQSRPPHPILRAYRWREPAVSIGIGHDAAAARAAAGPGIPIIRRWTGGGLVTHGRDQTYTLVVPAAGWPGAAEWQNSIRLHRHVHHCLSTILSQPGLAARCAEDGRQIPHGDCFQAPVRYDVVDADGKLAGAGQRRTRDGILMQGSLQGRAARDDVPRILATALAARTPTLPASWIPGIQAIQRLAGTKYHTLPPTTTLAVRVCE